MASAASQGVYEFGGFRLDPRRRSLTGPTGPVVITAKAFDELAGVLYEIYQRVERLGGDHHRTRGPRERTAARIKTKSAELVDALRRCASH